MGNELSDAELIRQLSAYIAGMESDREPESDDDDIEHWKREAEDAEARFLIERQAVETLRNQLQERVRMGRDDPVNTIAKLEAQRTELNRTIQQQREEMVELRKSQRDATDAKHKAESHLERAQEHELKAEKCIKEALGKYGDTWTGNWMDEACERIAAKREMTLEYLAGQLATAQRMHEGDSQQVVAYMLSVLGVTVAR